MSNHQQIVPCRGDDECKDGTTCQLSALQLHSISTQAGAANAVHNARPKIQTNQQDDVRMNNLHLFQFQPFVFRAHEMWS